MEEEKMDLLTFLKQTGREHLIGSCFQSPEGNFFTPTFDEEGNIVLIGEEIYAQWLKEQEEPPNLPPTTENLQKELESLKQDFNNLSGAIERGLSE